MCERSELVYISQFFCSFSQTRHLTVELSRPKPKLDWKTLKMTRQLRREKRGKNIRIFGKISKNQVFWRPGLFTCVLPQGKRNCTRSSKATWFIPFDLPSQSLWLEVFYWCGVVHVLKKVVVLTSFSSPPSFSFPSQRLLFPFSVWAIGFQRGSSALHQFEMICKKCILPSIPSFEKEGTRGKPANDDRLGIGKMKYW